MDAGTAGLRGVSFSRRSHTEDRLSEFYSLRRRAIKDVTGLIAFVIGWFASAPFGWPLITAGFESGQVTKGVAQFLVAVFGGACISGIAGLTLGAAGGWVWERVHRALRRRRTASASAAPPAGAAVQPTSDAARDARPPLPPLPPIRYDEGVLSVDDYVTLAQRVAPGEFHAHKTAAALARTINIGAWDGARLIGVARVLSDGYLFATVADLFVDADYRRRGVGRELMNRAFDRTPRGTLFVGARGATAPFFERLGCERGPSGFTMNRTARLR